MLRKGVGDDADALAVAVHDVNAVKGGHKDLRDLDNLCHVAKEAADKAYNVLGSTAENKLGLGSLMDSLERLHAEEVRSLRLWHLANSLHRLLGGRELGLRPVLFAPLLTHANHRVLHVDEFGRETLGHLGHGSQLGHRVKECHSPLLIVASGQRLHGHLLTLREAPLLGRARGGLNGPG